MVWVSVLQWPRYQRLGCQPVELVEGGRTFKSGDPVEITSLGCVSEGDIGTGASSLSSCFSAAMR
jgi:hypothetical protein